MSHGEDAPDAAAPRDAPDRLVFFFSGFDPKGAGHYHRLYREGAAARSALGDAQLEVGPRRRMGELAAACDLRWTIAGPDVPGSMPADEARTHLPSVRTRLHFMRWDDIVRRHWHRGAGQLLRDYAAVYGLGLFDGVFARIRRRSRAAWGMAIFPLVVALVSLGVSLPAIYLAARHGGSLGPVAAALLALLGAGLLWRGIVRWLDCEWLLRLYAFTRAQAVGALPALDARLDAMAGWIVRTVEARLALPGSPPLREVVMVGYSTGSIVASSVLARALPALSLLRQASGAGGSEGDPRFALSMLTLGHCVPVAADWAAARRVREDLRRLGDCEALTWHDWSSPADWAAFWRTPPWPEGGRLHGWQRSPRFHLQVSPGAYAALKQDRRRMHLQYLRAPERAGDPSGYDWFRLTAGPQTLAGEAIAR